MSANQIKKGVLLVNLGTPDSPSVPDVRKYLREFLMDERVIDIPYIKRWLLINLIIATFRSPKSAAEYQKLWDEKGSPLKYYGVEVTDLLQKKLGEEYVVALGMRYQSPSIKSALDILKSENVGEILVIPLFPQYASASTGSVIQKVNELVNEWQIIPSLRYISKFWDHPSYINGFVEKGKAMMAKTDYDHVVFSYHGLPERHIRKGSSQGYCQLNGKCCSNYSAKNQYCYSAQCFQTSKLLAEGLGLSEDKYTTTFQSRLGKTPWIKPYTDEVLQELPAKGIKKVLAFSPAFIADCLETTIEVGETFKEEFLEAGGETWDLVESLNNSEGWIEGLAEMAKGNS
jgi:ferrochelatase